ncbi:hypothetical protein [Streptomyces sp. Ag109_O5-1]|uniref:hypothetical protein n=1 Tax=Streptomyces sp. Ag109_O5-1 TaxID=1938851 RepID=UPI0021A551CC|nr:hypothetical protein [Streptomyces sp. Ag109_O5-1]
MSEGQVMDDDRWSKWPEPWAGTDFDMRTVVSAIPREVKDGFKYDEIPWQRFPHFYGPGEEIPGLLATLAAGDLVPPAGFGPATPALEVSLVGAVARGNADCMVPGPGKHHSVLLTCSQGFPASCVLNPFRLGAAFGEESPGR